MTQQVLFWLWKLWISGIETKPTLTEIYRKRRDLLSSSSIRSSCTFRSITNYSHIIFSSWKFLLSSPKHDCRNTQEKKINWYYSEPCIDHVLSKTCYLTEWTAGLVLTAAHWPKVWIFNFRAAEIVVHNCKKKNKPKIDRAKCKINSIGLAISNCRMI